MFVIAKLDGKHWGVFLISVLDPEVRYLMTSPLDDLKLAERLCQTFMKIVNEEI